jgi:hypothetical protein
MRRKAAVFLTVLMLVSMLIPVQSFAQSDDELTKAITVAKEKFDIPEDYQFTYNVYTDNGKRVWYLSWASKDKVSGSINVRIDEKGTITGYDNYKPDNYSEQRKLPKYSKKDAKAIAEKFIERVNPGLMSKLKCQENTQNSLMDYSYYFQYVRMVNGIPFYNNYTGVSINRNTGEVISYYYYWDDSLEFPALDKVIPADQAQSAYKEKLGLKLVYNYSLEGEKLRIYPVYMPRYDNNLYAVDAFTGEKVQLGPVYRGYYDGNLMEQKKQLAMAAGDFSSVTLTPEELKAIDEVSKLITAEEAEKIARAAGFLKLTADYKLDTPNLSRSWLNRDEFIWSLNFTKAPANEKESYLNVNCTINAVTGEIKSFYRSIPYKEGSKPSYNEEKSRAAAEKFLKEFTPEKFDDMEYDEEYNRLYLDYAASELPTQYNFHYTRKVNGIPFPGNDLSVTFDAVNGQVTSYNLNWFDMEFPSIDKVVSIDDVYNTLFLDIGIELQYKTRYGEADYKKVVMPSQQKLEVKLVYSLKPDKPLTFDANSGVMLNYDGKPYKENKPVEYTDIAGNFAEKQISVLAEYGVALDGTEFKPYEYINQKDFLTLLSKTLGSYYGPVITASSSNEDIDNMYVFMMREGVLKQGEKTPDAAVMREEAVKYIIRALKYDKVAGLKDIFSCQFKDVSEINPDLVGYVSIAGGLKIVSGNNGNFMPKNKLTRAEAAVVIYNYLQN